MTKTLTIEEVAKVFEKATQRNTAEYEVLQVAFRNETNAEKRKDLLKLITSNIDEYATICDLKNKVLNASNNEEAYNG